MGGAAADAVTAPGVATAAGWGDVVGDRAVAVVDGVGAAPVPLAGGHAPGADYGGSIMRFTAADVVALLGAVLVAWSVVYGWRR
jgi:hypothetical protein